MKKLYIFICIIMVVVFSIFYVRLSTAQEKVQQVFDVACIASDIPSFKDCIQKVQDGKADFVKITEMITCQSQDDCAMRLSDIKRTVLIYGSSNTGSGFKRVNNYNYAIFTLQNSANISLGGFLIDDTAGAPCPEGTCPPAIIVENSDKTLIESLNTKSVKNTAILVKGSKNTIIKKSIFDNSQKYAVEVQSSSSDTIIENNSFKDSWSNGVVFASAGKNRIDNNIFGHNHKYAAYTNCVAPCAGAQLSLTANSGTISAKKNTIRNGNIETYGSFGLTASGIEIAGNNIESVHLSCNVISDNSGNGIVVPNRSASMKKLEIRNNTLLNNGIDMNFSITNDDKIENNCTSSSCPVTNC